MDRDGRVLLVRLSASADLPGVWTLPGGDVGQGEHPATALVREFRADTGLTVQVVGLRAVESDVAPARGGTVVLHSDRVIYDVRCDRPSRLRRRRSCSG